MGHHQGHATVLWLPTVLPKSQLWPAVLGLCCCSPVPQPKGYKVWLWLVITQVGGGALMLLCNPPLGSNSWLCPAITGLCCSSSVPTPRLLSHGTDPQSSEPSCCYLQLPPGGPELGLWPTIPRAYYYTLPLNQSQCCTLSSQGLCYCSSPQHTHTHTRPKLLPWALEMQVLVPQEICTGLHLRHQHHHHKKCISVPGPRGCGSSKSTWFQDPSSAAALTASTPDLGTREITSNKISSPK